MKALTAAVIVFVIIGLVLLYIMTENGFEHPLLLIAVSVIVIIATFYVAGIIENVSEEMPTFVINSLSGGIAAYIFVLSLSTYYGYNDRSGSISC